MAEWTIAPVLKTGAVARWPQVRILLPPNLNWIMTEKTIAYFFPKGKLIVQKADKKEIREGRLILENQTFKIQKGIVYVPIKSPEALKEQKAIVKIDHRPELGGGGKIPSKVFDDALNHLPWGGDNPLFYRPGSFQNIALGAKDFRGLLDQLSRFNQKLTILEIGADSFWATHQVAQAGHRVVGLDISHHLQLRDFWLKNDQPSFDGVQAEMNNLPFRPAVFDLVFAIESIHHSPKLPAVARQIWLCLKPGGQFVFLREPMKGRWSKDEFGQRQKAIGISENIYSPADWQKAFQKAGFKNLKIELADFDWQKLWLKSSFKDKLRFLARASKHWLVKEFPSLRQFFIASYNFSGQKSKPRV